MKFLRRLWEKKREHCRQRNAYKIQKSAHLQAILRELIQPAHINDMPHRVALCQEALVLVSKSDHPQRWATLQVELGNCLIRNPLGDRRQNLELAIAAYQQALTVRTKEGMPLEWATTMNNLAIAYQSNVFAERWENIEKAIYTYQQVLTVWTQDTSPIDWATTMNNLGNVYWTHVLGDRSTNIETAIAAYQQSLTILTYEALPIEWASAINNLANAYSIRICGNQAENKEAAIAACQQALVVMTRDAMPIEWAKTLMNLATIYQSRIRGDRSHNIEAAIRAYRQALTVLTQEAMPIEWATTMTNLASAYIERICGNQAENVETAIAACDQALKVRSQETMPVGWAETMYTLGNAFQSRSHGDRAQNIEDAIVAYQQALIVLTQDTMPFAWGKTMTDLATALRERIRGDREENIESALAVCKQVLAAITKESLPIEWANAMDNLANAYYLRVRDDRTQNMETALDAYQQVLTIRTKEAMPDKWAITMTNIANAYSDRLRGDRAENLEIAISAYQQALGVRTQEANPIKWAETMHNLAIAYANRIHGNRAENLESAITAYQQALAVRNQKDLPIEWAMTMNNLAIAYAERICGNKAENIELAITTSQQALTVRTKEAMPVAWAETMHNLATTYYDRINGHKMENLKLAVSTFMKALDVRTQNALPAEHRRTQRNLANLLFAEARWADAAVAYNGALAAHELLYQVAATPEARQAELRAITNLPASQVYSIARQVNNQTILQQTLITLEHNRARWLTENLAFRSDKPANIPDRLWQNFMKTATQIRQLQTEAQLSDETPGKREFLTLSARLAEVRANHTQVIQEIRSFAPEFMPTPSFADIWPAFATNGDSPTEIGIYLLTTTQGSLALIIHAKSVRPVWLDALTEDMSLTLLRGWFEAYSTFFQQHTDKAKEQWFTQLDTVTGHLWELLMGPIVTALEEIDLSSGKTGQPPVVALIPLGLLARLPFHAAWTPDATMPTGRRYFTDDYTVRYVPSATALRHCRERVSNENVEQLLALDEPKPINNGSPLPNSAREVKTIASLFSTPTVLRHEQASRAATGNALAAAQVAHFSCHGVNNWDNPLDSGLLLANDELLTVRDFLELHLPGARLATLSACETGIVGTNLPDEVIMLPSALVQAGYAGVVASLWSVAEVSTALLMTRFYQEWRENRLEPVYALRAAQRWLRDATVTELQLAQIYAEQYQSSGRRDRNAFNAQRYYEAHPEERPFQHPFYWAAFYLTGV